MRAAVGAAVQRSSAQIVAWTIAVIGLVGALIFVYMNTPLPWMLGSMTATTIAALSGARISAPSVVRTPMILIIGLMVGATFTPDILQRFGEWWPTVVGLILLGLASGA